MNKNAKGAALALALALGVGLALWVAGGGLAPPDPIRVRRAKERVPFAHGSWVIWDAYPNGLILKPILDFKYQQPMLYTMKDFEEIESRLQGLQDTINDFSKRSSPSAKER